MLPKQWGGGRDEKEDMAFNSSVEGLLNSLFYTAIKDGMRPIVLWILPLYIRHRLASYCAIFLHVY